MRERLEDYAPHILCVAAFYLLARNVIAAGSKPLGYDEMCTLAITSQPTVGAMWGALARGVDGHPIGFYLVERLATSLLSNKEIAYRLPSALGFVAAVVFTFLYVKKTGGRLFALLASSLLVLTTLHQTYAVDARPYPLLVACVAFSLLCYQRTSSWIWVVLLGLSLAVTQSLQYYAVFALAPLAIAEAFWWYQTKSIRLGVWLAFVVGIVPLGAMWPVLAHLRSYYGAHFWAHPSVFATARMYGGLFQMPAPLGVAATGLLARAIAFLPRVDRVDTAAEVEVNALDRREAVLLLALLALPIIGFTAAKVMHAGLIDRYVLPAVLAIPLGFGRILPRLSRRAVVGFTVFVIIAMPLQELSFWSAHRSILPRLENPSASLDALLESAHQAQELPVVISDGIDYLPLAHYAPAGLASRLVALVDPAEAVARSGSDSVDLNLIVLPTAIPLRVYSYAEFSAAHGDFLLYSSGASDGFDWWPGRLRKDGHELIVAAVEQNRVIYRVHLRKAESAP